jgi:hypothetical protein
MEMYNDRQNGYCYEFDSEMSSEFEDDLGEIDYPDEPMFSYETEQLMDILDIDLETLVSDLGEQDEQTTISSIILYAVQRLEEYVYDDSIFKVEEILKNDGLNFVDEYKQTELLHIACVYGCPDMVEILCRYNIDGYNWQLGTDMEMNLDFERVFENLQVIIEMGYFEQFGEFLVNILWFSDNLPRQGRRCIINYLYKQHLLEKIQENYLKKEVKDQFIRQFLPSVSRIVPFGVNYLILEYMC